MSKVERRVKNLKLTLKNTLKIIMNKQNKDKLFQFIIKSVLLNNFRNTKIISEFKVKQQKYTLTKKLIIVKQNLSKLKHKQFKITI